VVRADTAVHELRAGDELTFGRDVSCTVRLDTTDRGISRIAGRVRMHEDIWYVTNLSGPRR
jgi:hypothetical protein